MFEPKKHEYPVYECAEIRDSKKVLRFIVKLCVDVSATSTEYYVEVSKTTCQRDGSPMTAEAEAYETEAVYKEDFGGNIVAAKRKFGEMCVRYDRLAEKWKADSVEARSYTGTFDFMKDA